MNAPARAFRASYSGPRRLLRRVEAATYAGISESKFDDLVDDGRMPKPVKIDGCVLWDIRRLDLAIDAITEAIATEDTWATL